jgi:hypothetical protein
VFDWRINNFKNTTGDVLSNKSINLSQDAINFLQSRLEAMGDRNNMGTINGQTLTREAIRNAHLRFDGYIEYQKVSGEGENAVYQWHLTKKVNGQFVKTPITLNNRSYLFMNALDQALKNGELRDRNGDVIVAQAVTTAKKQALYNQPITKAVLEKMNRRGGYNGVYVQSFQPAIGNLKAFFADTNSNALYDQGEAIKYMTEQAPGFFPLLSQDITFSKAGEQVMTDMRKGSFLVRLKNNAGGYYTTIEELLAKNAKDNLINYNDIRNESADFKLFQFAIKDVQKQTVIYLDFNAEKSTVEVADGIVLGMRHSTFYPLDILGGNINRVKTIGESFDNGFDTNGERHILAIDARSSTAKTDVFNAAGKMVRSIRLTGQLERNIRPVFHEIIHYDSNENDLYTTTIDNDTIEYVQKSFNHVFTDRKLNIQFGKFEQNVGTTLRIFDNGKDLGMRSNVTGVYNVTDIDASTKVVTFVSLRELEQSGGSVLVRRSILKEGVVQVNLTGRINLPSEFLLNDAQAIAKRSNRTLFNIVEEGRAFSFDR